MNTTTIFLATIFGAIGTGYLVYGKKQQKMMALISGLALCGIPYLISNALLLTAVSVLVIILPFVLRF
jgi:hypothetical protein